MSAPLTALAASGQILSRLTVMGWRSVMPILKLTRWPMAIGMH